MDVGDRLPDISLLNQAGQPVDFETLRGRRIVIFTFPKAGTGGCTMQACAFRDKFPAIDVRNTIIFGLSADSPAELSDWKQKENLPYDLLSDPDNKLLTPLGANGVFLLGLRVINIKRGVYIFDENGVLCASKMSMWPPESAAFAVETLNSMSEAQTV